MKINNIIKKTQKQLSKFSRIVIWGFKSPNNDSFRHILQSFYNAGVRLGVPTFWVDDESISTSVVVKGSLVIAVNIQSNYLPKRKGVYYCLHNFDSSFSKDLEKNHALKLQVYTSDADMGTKKIDPARRYDPVNQVLYQPWGTDLWPEDFKTPIMSRYSRLVYWVGSIWDNDNHQGNLIEIKKLKSSLLKNWIFFVHKKFASDEDNIQYMRKSRFAPTIAGQWQVSKNYLPCRMFKNISYGQLGITNVPKFKEIFGKNLIYSQNVLTLVNKSLETNENKWFEIIAKQQEIVKLNYTYVNSLYYIAKAFDWINI